MWYTTNSSRCSSSYMQYTLSICLVTVNSCFSVPSVPLKGHPKKGFQKVRDFHLFFFLGIYSCYFVSISVKSKSLKVNLPWPIKLILILKNCPSFTTHVVLLHSQSFFFSIPPQSHTVSIPEVASG